MLPADEMKELAPNQWVATAMVTDGSRMDTSHIWLVIARYCTAGAFLHRTQMKYIPVLAELDVSAIRNKVKNV
jgi:hypothetical protein